MVGRRPAARDRGIGPGVTTWTPEATSAANAAPLPEAVVGDSLAQILQDGWAAERGLAVGLDAEELLALDVRSIDQTTVDGAAMHSARALLHDLATLEPNARRRGIASKPMVSFSITTTPTPGQQHALA